MTKLEHLGVEDEEAFIGTLVNLALRHQFRTAWNYLETNVDPDNIRIYDAGVLLQQLSNEVGDIGEIKDECILKSKLEFQAGLIQKLLR